MYLKSERNAKTRSGETDSASRRREITDRVLTRDNSHTEEQGKGKGGKEGMEDGSGRKRE